MSRKRRSPPASAEEGRAEFILAKVQHRLDRLDPEARAREVQRVRSTIVKNLARVILKASRARGLSIERFVATDLITPELLEDRESVILMLSAVAELARQDEYGKDDAR